MTNIKDPNQPQANDGCAGCLFVPTRMFGLMKKEFWALRVQSKFQNAVRTGDHETTGEIMVKAISRSLKSGLSRTELKWLERATNSDRETVHSRLAAAFQLGSNRDKSFQLSLSNAMDEVMREAQAIAREQRLIETSL
jgi:hypothetical protein